MTCAETQLRLRFLGLTLCNGLPSDVAGGAFGNAVLMAERKAVLFGSLLAVAERHRKANHLEESGPNTRLGAEGLADGLRVAHINLALATICKAALRNRANSVLIFVPKIRLISVFVIHPLALVAAV